MSKERLEEIKEWHENDGEMHQFQIDWLIEQAEQNYRIQKENAKLSIMLRTAQSDLFDIQQQNKRYREAIDSMRLHAHYPEIIKQIYRELEGEE